MGYTRSKPLQHWLGERADVLAVLAEAQALGVVSGPGRRLDFDKPLSRAYVIGIVSEFQGFSRELHNLALELIVKTSGATADFVPLLSQGLASGRRLDHGNPDLRTLRQDFGRLGLPSLDFSRHNPRWAVSDRADFIDCFRLRNAVVHGNDRELKRLRTEGVMDTVTWAKPRLTVLNRMAQSLDRLVWDHLFTLFKQEPWR